MTFALPTGYLSKKKLDKIQMKAVSATLTKGGFVSKFPRKVAFGPHQYGGLAMHPIWAEQLVQQVQACAASSNFSQASAMPERLPENDTDQFGMGST
jgi:hypothetical protein